MNNQEIEKFDHIIKNARQEDYITFDGSYDEFISALKRDNAEAVFSLSAICQIYNYNDIEGWSNLLKRASDLGCEGAQEQLADFYDMNDKEDEYLPGNQSEAIRLYRILADKGNKRGLYKMALYYLDETSEEWNPDLGTRYLEAVGDKDDSLAEYVARNFESLGDYDRAIKYYKIAKVYEGDDYFSDFEIDEENVMSCYYPSLAYLYYKKGDIPNTIKYINKGIVAENSSDCHYLRGIIYLDSEDVDKAINSFMQSASADSYYQLGLLYFDGKYIKPEKEKALYYFERAAELGCECSGFVNSLKREVNNDKENEYTRYLLNTINDSIELHNYPKLAEQDLKKDFGNHWDKLSEFSKNVLITGITSLMTYMSYENNNQDVHLDYSVVIISIARALERETKEVFYSKFRNYLEIKRIDPQYYKRLAGFVVEDNVTGRLSYTHNDFWYTLGKLEKIVHKHKATTYYGREYITVNRDLLGFCNDYVFKSNAFSNNPEKRKDDICNYLIQFSEQVEEIARNYRNEAAHTDTTSNLERARSCVDWILKVQKILLMFISKIDYSKMNRI